MELLTEQIAFLQNHFRVSNSFAPNSPQVQSVAELLDTDFCRTYIQDIAKEFDTASLLVSASQFSKRYSFMLALPALYAMSVFHRGLPIELQNCYIQFSEEHTYWNPQLALADWAVSAPDADEYDSWREQVLGQLFAENIGKVWATLQESTGIKPAILWENTVIYIHWFYQQQLADNAAAQADYQYLLTADPALFGLDFNPLVKYPVTNGERKTCCLYFLTNEEKQVCKGCPRKQQGLGKVAKKKRRSVAVSS